MRVMLSAAVLGLLSGCGTTSKVEYRNVAAPSDMQGLTDAFYMRRTVLEVSAASAKGRTGEDRPTVETTITIQAAPKEERSARIGIKAHRGFLSTTRINITKVENTDLVKSIGVETTDETVNRINQIGGTIVKLIKLAALPGALVEPERRCLTEASGKRTLDLDPSQSSQTFSVGYENCITVTYGPRAAEAIARANLPANQTTSMYYYSACREAVVTIRQSDTQTITETVRVNDPAYLQYVQFPVKGKIEHHSQCGVSVTTEAYTQTNPADVVGALEAQGKAIKDALDAASKDEPAG